MCYSFSAEDYWQRFSHFHSADYVCPIIQLRHILFIGGNRYIPAGSDSGSVGQSTADPFTGGSRYVPPQTNGLSASAAGTSNIFHLFILYVCIIRKTLKDRKQTNMEGGQSGTYLRLMRASSGPRVSVTKTYRDETK